MVIALLSGGGCLPQRISQAAQDIVGDISRHLLGCNQIGVRIDTRRSPGSPHILCLNNIHPPLTINVYSKDWQTNGGLLA